MELISLSFQTSRVALRNTQETIHQNEMLNQWAYRIQLAVKNFFNPELRSSH
jgi:hypothetical protein